MDTACGDEEKLKANNSVYPRNSKFAYFAERL